LPAIHLARLRKQAVELASYFTEPKRFDFHFTQLLDFYSNRTIKPGKPTSSKSQVKAYKVQDPVLRIILVEISPSAANDPEAALNLAKSLWNSVVLEKRIFAIRLLGLLPAQDAPSTFDRIEDWSQACHEELLLEEFASHPLLAVHQENWLLYLEYLNKWLGSKSQSLVRLSLISIAVILKERSVIDLPPVFKLLLPLFSEPEFSQRSLLNPIFRSLSRQSPDEMMFLIRQIYSSQESKNKNFIKLLKLNLEYFPERYQESLESMISLN
jgi:hypothetical protein